LVCPPPGAGKASIQRRGWVLANRRRRPLPLLSLRRGEPRMERSKWSAARGRPCGCASTADNILICSLEIYLR
jgi:hypothetical protein